MQLHLFAGFLLLVLTVALMFAQDRVLAHELASRMHTLHVEVIDHL